MAGKFDRVPGTDATTANNLLDPVLATGRPVRDALTDRGHPARQKRPCAQRFQLIVDRDAQRSECSFIDARHAGPELESPGYSRATSSAVEVDRGFCASADDTGQRCAEQTAPP